MKSTVAPRMILAFAVVVATGGGLAEASRGNDAITGRLESQEIQ